MTIRERSAPLFHRAGAEDLGCQARTAGPHPEGLRRSSHPHTIPSLTTCSSLPLPQLPQSHLPSRMKDPEEGGVVPGGARQGVHRSQLVEVDLRVRGRAHQPRLQERRPLLLQGPCSPHVTLADGREPGLVSLPGLRGCRRPPPRNSGTRTLQTRATRATTCSA